LFNGLKTWRLLKAREQEVPPYIIFHDSVIKEIALLRPCNFEQLKKIKGIGNNKLERYGQSLLNCIKDIK
ncbi:HRDC domain-containing protein, partial [Commensalibacter sp. Nvir]|uniref:HRDC domain-containing protein n=1 Tax=Commensalibacter sp. Nvir TaxID=3069817 RepID=UPI0030C8D2A4